MTEFINRVHLKSLKIRVDIVSYKKHVMLIALSLCLAILLYSKTIQWLLYIWGTDRVYAHGYVIPFVSLYLVWCKREHLCKLDINPAILTGVLISALSAGLLYIGRVGSFIQLEAFSLMMIIPGVILCFFGWKYLQALLVPILYLQFMVPWFEELLESKQIIFQHITAYLSSGLLRLIGFQLYHDSVYIQLPNITLEVAKECSGLLFFISVIAIGIPLVYLTQRTYTRALLVLFSSVLITLFANGLRVMLAGIMGHYFGAELLHGPGHIFRGWFVAQIGWVGVFLVNWRVKNIKTKQKYRIFEKWMEKHQPNENPSVKKLPYGATAIFISCFLILGVLLNTNFLLKAVHLQKGLQSFPIKIKKWNGYDKDWISKHGYFHQMDQSISRIYHSPEGRPVLLYIGYQSRQSFNKRILSFLDEPLFRKQDKKILKSNSESFTVVSSSPIIGGRELRTLIWYRLPSGLYGNRLKAKIATMKDGVLMKRNNAFVVVLSTDSNFNRETDNEVTPDYLIEFGIAINEALNKYWNGI